MNTKNLVIGVLVGLLIGFIAVLFEVPSLRALARIGALGTFAGLIGTFLFWRSNAAPQAPEKRIFSDRGSVSTGAIGFMIVAVLFIVGGVALIEQHTVRGGFIGVAETMNGGVDPTPRLPKTYFYIRIATEIYDYDIQPQTFSGDVQIKSSDSQRVTIPYTVRWHRDPEKVVWMHQNLRDPNKVLDAELDNVVTINSTVETAMAIYAGESQNKLRAKIEEQLKSKTGELFPRGVIIDNFVFGRIDLNPEYVENIEKRQIAMIAQSRAVEEQKVAEARALVTKAEAQSDLNKQVVAAERDKQVAILQQQALSEKSTIEANAKALNLVVEQKSLSEKQVLAAEAAAKATIATAEASKLAEVNRAIGIEAVGKAEATANKLKLESFQGTGGENYTKIEVAKQVAVAYQNQKGYLPANMSINLLTENFDKSVSLLIDGNKK